MPKPHMIRITDERIYQRLEYLAKQDSRSVTTYLNTLLKKTLQL